MAVTTAPLEVRRKHRRGDFTKSGKRFLSGGIAGAVSRTLVSPLERLKILYMCDVDGRFKQLGVWGSLTHIWKTDGMKGFFRGNGANMIRIFPFSAIQLSVYPLYKQLLGVPPTAKPGVAHFAAGCCSGVTATVATYPLDFIRSRLSVQSPQLEVYSGVFDGLKQVMRREGILALYTGMAPTLAGIIPYAGIQLSVYDWSKEKLASLRPSGLSQQRDFFVAGAFAGAVAQTVAFPLELLRRRMQTERFLLAAAGPAEPPVVAAAVAVKARGVPRPGFFRTAAAVLRREGVLGLYRGLFPNLLKIVPAAGASFWTFEKVNMLLGLSTAQATKL